MSAFTTSAALQAAEYLKTGQAAVETVSMGIPQPTWETPTHDEIDLSKVEPEDLGLDSFDMDNPLVRRICQAQDSFIEPESTEPEPIEQKIQKLESVNKELMEELPDSAEITLPQVPADASNEEKLEVLEEINEKLTDVINAPEE